METPEKTSTRPVAKKSGTTYGSVLKEVFDGTILTKGFFRKNVWMILIVVTGLLVYIGNHYGVIMALNKIDDLNQTLADVKYEALTQSSLLMKESRQSRVRELVEEKGLALVDSKTPPFVIQVEE
jgi:hypothetical protein